MKKFPALLLVFVLALCPLALPASADDAPVLSARDRQLLARVLAAECPDDTDLGVRIALAAVVLNRLSDGRFGDTAAQVIYGDALFAGVSTGRVLRPADRDELSLSLAAVDFASAGLDPTSGALWFGSAEKGGDTAGARVRFTAEGWWFW